MLNNYSKRFSLTSFGGDNWIWLTGFEQIVTNGVSTYYAIDSAPTSRIVTFNQFWIYQGYQNLQYLTCHILMHTQLNMLEDISTFHQMIIFIKLIRTSLL